MLLAGCVVNKELTMTDNDFEGIDLDLAGDAALEPAPTPNQATAEPVTVKPPLVEPLPIKKSKKLFLIVIILVLLSAAVGVYWFVFHKAQAPTTPSATATERSEPLYYVFEPNFNVNLKDAHGSERQLQVEIGLLVRSEHLKSIIDKNSPLMKDDILNLLGTQSYETLQEQKGREVLKGKILTIANKKLDEIKEKEHVETVLFTRFVME